MKRLGFLDGRRPVVGGVVGWSGVPALLIPGQGQVFGIFEDFLKSTELAAGEAPTGWETELSGVGEGTFIIAEQLGGAGRWQTDGGDDHAIQSTLGSVDGGAFIPQVDKDIWFEARVKLSHIAEIIVAIGLQDPSETIYMGNAGAGPAVQNHLLFTAVDAGAGVTENWHFEGGKVAAEEDKNLAIPLVALPTWFKLGFHVHGVTKVDVLVDDAIVAAGEIVTANIPTTGLMPVVCLKGGAAEIQTLYVDYIMCVQKR